VILYEVETTFRQIFMDGRKHPADTSPTWQGYSVGKWEGDTLVVETTNLNGKAWLNEVGEIISHAATVTERFTPIDKDTIQYDATISDPRIADRILAHRARTPGSPSAPA